MNLVFPCPDVLDLSARRLAEALGAGKRDLFAAAARAVVSRPPEVLIAYTDARLLVARQKALVALDPTLHRAVRDIAVHRFYGRVTWLFWWGLAHIHSNELVHFLRSDAETLAAFDAVAYEHWTGGHPCRIPPTARAPRPPRPRTERTRTERTRTSRPAPPR